MSVLREESANQPGVRPISQDRSVARRRQLVDATIRAIAEHGVSGVTHRMVARYANVSLAATTYYYATKLDMIADASKHLLAANLENFERFAQQRMAHTATSFRDLGRRVVINATDANKMGTLAWCEIVLAGARDPDARALTVDWFQSQKQFWRRIAKTLDMDRPDDVARSAIDIDVGLVFTAMAMGVSKDQAHNVLRGIEDFEQAWRPPGRPLETPPPQASSPSGKAHHTREKILSAATAILTTEGKAGVTYRAVAERAGLTAAAPTYHFPSIDTLLASAQERLFRGAGARRRHATSSADFGSYTMSELIDFIADTFLREATTHGLTCTASYMIWLEAARRPNLRPVVWSGMESQHRAGKYLLEHLSGEQRPLDALTLLALFVGKMIRVLSTGAQPADLAKVRSEFAYDIQAIVAGRHWSTRQEGA